MIKRRILIGSLSGLSFSIRTAIKDEPLMLILPPCFFFFLFFFKKEAYCIHCRPSTNHSWERFLKPPVVFQCSKTPFTSVGLERRLNRDTVWTLHEIERDGFRVNESLRKQPSFFSSNPKWRFASVAFRKTPLEAGGEDRRLFSKAR